MKKKTVIILVVLLAALTVGTAVTLASCQNPQQSEKVQSSSVSDSSTESGAEESPEASEESVVSEETSAESKTESSAETSEDSKTESSKESKTESSEDSKAESSKESKSEGSKESKAESSKTETKPTTKTESKPATKPTTTKTGTKQAPKITATSVTLDINNLNLTAGGSRELNAYVHYSDGSSNYSGITWSSSNTGVATVDSYGNVYAHSAGTAQITASYGSFKASCSITVKAAQQSKPQTQYTSNNNNSGGNSGSSSSNSSNNGSSNNGGSTTKKQTNTNNNSGGNSGGSTTTKKQTNNGGNSGGNTQTKKQQTTSKWKASDHEKDKVYSTGGYVMYEMPEILPYVNYYRRQAGVPELEWSSGNAYYNKIKNMFYNLSKEEQKQIRNESPEYFNSRGEFDAKKFVDTDNMSTRNCLEYCLKTHTLDHGNEYDSSHTSLINGTMASYDPQEKVESIKNNSPGHWEGLMNPELTTLYVVYSGDASTGFVITFN